MKTAKNDITGDIIKTHVNTLDYLKNHSQIFGEPVIVECGNCGIKTKKVADDEKCRYCGECLTCD